MKRFFRGCPKCGGLMVKAGKLRGHQMWKCTKGCKFATRRPIVDKSR